MSLNNKKKNFKNINKIKIYWLKSKSKQYRK